jgi:hypothetical protein
LLCSLETFWGHITQMTSESFVDSFWYRLLTFSFTLIWVQNVVYLGIQVVDSIDSAILCLYIKKAILVFITEDKSAGGIIVVVFELS